VMHIMIYPQRTAGLFSVHGSYKKELQGNDIRPNTVHSVGE
jgi:hypothetical protein